MSLLPILRFPDPRLHIKADAVDLFDDSLSNFISSMAETMYHSGGIGLAATQVNVHKRIIVLDISDLRNSLLALVNPEIEMQVGSQTGSEGCLSVPGVYDDIERAARIEVKYFDVKGNAHSIIAENLLAVCIQHEIDHLNGKVFVQYLSQLKQQRIRRKLLRDAK